MNNALASHRNMYSLGMISKSTADTLQKMEAENDERGAQDFLIQKLGLQLKTLVLYEKEYRSARRSDA